MSTRTVWTRDFWSKSAFLTLPTYPSVSVKQFFGLKFGMFTLRVQSRGLITLDSGWGLFVQPAAQLRDEDEDVDNDNEEEDNNDNDDYDDEANHNHPN